MIKKTKIVATIGPATSSVEMLSKLLKAGLNVMRLNFSHGDFKEHQEKLNNFKIAMKNTGIRGAIMQDLSGPKIRLGEFSTEKVMLKTGDNITITTEQIIGNEKKVSINYPLFAKEVKKGDQIMVDDGKKKFEVVSINGKEVLCKILVGGETKGRRGVNLPDSDISVSSLTEKDKKDIEFGFKNHVDFFAFSFVRTPADVIELREILNKRKSKAKIIAKIETPQAVKNIDAILELCDGLMVARGDLAIEVPAERVPMIQKMLIKKCNDAGKMVITATQMLESMIKSPVPTRAEVSDIANAILDGTDAVMLSEETTLGLYPVEAVKVMSKVALDIEENYPEREVSYINDKGDINVTDSITGSVVKTAHNIGARAIVALTKTGFTARMISRHKPKAFIIAVTSEQITSNQLALSFGCLPLKVDEYKTALDIEVFKAIRNYCIKNKIASKGDKVVIATCSQWEKKGGATNMIMVETI
ncbi:TPA: pyruvate kinase [Candidatus Nomurabacteria bacterium]|nr:MAG: Pyruvate kinase [Candidatus Nomurabacteria bacterium GW2011_GWF2_36_126]KKP96341.1 MAG: Pyruvate kinase [Candidatus Nomurabacteria bacterium GW2011_GWD2_36_14]KKP99002.1 MAG: Pyruvate kinase [Candidatus Nomurabacteria bacterium GW2011_GWF2_36_19]KKQ05168.1 MAG: Pyruvate kinase [Candidatus Nomurabacteria bacterium GW2011_GWF1_36_47]KKQ09153.1 MAG: Pyruvate kinase [Candidatus Nomurabacteria bacterium GW2011_GWB1_36_6]KKQ12702.1 MAG: Pyruvate kinase [Candidatus Nomurabacteria bacterium GW